MNLSPYQKATVASLPSIASHPICPELFGLGLALMWLYQKSAFASGQNRISKPGKGNRLDALEAVLGLANGFRTVC